MDDLEGVPQDSSLIRRINPDFCDWTDLDSERRPRITRQAVQFYREEEAARLGCPGPAMSLVLETNVEDLEKLAARYPGYGFARISAEELRAGGSFGAQLWPTDEDPSHVVVFRLDGASRPSGSQAKRIAGALNQGWLVAPSPPTGSVEHAPILGS